MPIARDLTDQRFGKLVVLAAAGKTAERHPKKRWRCRCDCGAEEVIAQPRLTGGSRPYRSCSACRQPDCQVCRKTIPLDYRSKTVCSDICKTAYKRAQYRTDYYRRKERDPDLNKRKRERLAERAKTDPAVAQRLRDYNDAHNAKRRERRRTDPEYAARLAAISRKRYHRNSEQILARRRLRRRLDPEHAEYRREWSRKHYQKRREETLAARRRRWFQLTPAEQRAEQDAQRERNRQWRQRWRENLCKDPKAHREQLAREREWERDRNLRQLFKNLDKLTDSSKGNRHDD